MHSEDLRALTPLNYSHVTPYGTFRLDINLSHLWSGRAATVMAQYFTQVGNLSAFVSAHPHLNLTQRKAVLLAHRLIQENVIEFVATYNSVQGSDQPNPFDRYHF